MELKEEMGKPMVTAGDFHTPLSATDRTIREPGRTQKNSTIHQPTDLISILNTPSNNRIHIPFKRINRWQ